MKYTYKPLTFWLVTIGITWLSLFIAAYCSYTEKYLPFKNIFILIALFTPFTVAMIMIYTSKNEALKKDFKKRLCDVRSIRRNQWLALLFIMPITLIVATIISLVFGQPTTQFFLSPELTLLGGETLIILIILVLAPTFEELGWRGYGIDSIKKERSVLKTTFLYALLWLLWHVPLFFINGYYQNELFHLHPLFALNFVISLLPAAFLMNWIYYKANRSIIAIILFHIMINLFSILLQTTQVTKCIITALLIILSTSIFLKDKEFFLKSAQEEPQSF